MLFYVQRCKYMSHCFISCAVPECSNGFLYRGCMSCGGRPRTCNDTFCPLVCVPGCDCPIGQVLNKATNRCVKSCSAVAGCPIKGQVFKTCVECYKNPFTCSSPSHGCYKICAPGCECPHGQVLDTNTNRCVPLRLCFHQG